MHKPLGTILVFLALIHSGTPPTFASDGIVEINQACMMAGCFSGDSPMFPVTIDGSAGTNYILTGDLTVPNENTTAIQLYTDGISLDLNGFSIRGVTTCTFIPQAVCSPVGTGSGVFGGNLTHIRNGRVMGMGNWGIAIGFDTVVENVRVLNSGVGGIQLGGGSAVRNVTANANNGNGIEATFRDGVYSSIATNNNQNGIVAGAGSIVRESIVHSNGLSGIMCYNDCLVTDNEASGNGEAGLKGQAVDCAAFGKLAYGGNTINFNAVSSVLGCAAQVGANICNGVLCP